MRDGSLLAGEGRRWGRSGPGEVCVGRGGSPSWGSCCAPPAGHIVRIPTTVGRLGGAGLERVLPLADSGQCCLLCLARRKGAEQGVAHRVWATSRVMLLEGRGRLGTDLFDDKSTDALWALDRLPGDVLPPSFPWSAHRG